MKESYDPILNTSEPHSFAISSLFKASYKDEILIISCDVSGEIYFRYVSEVRVCLYI